MGIKSASGKRRRKAVSFNSCHLRVGAKTTNAIYSMKEEEKKNELKISFIEMKRYTKSKRERRAMTRDIFSPHSWHGTHTQYLIFINFPIIQTSRFSQLQVHNHAHSQTQYTDTYLSVHAIKSVRCAVP